MAKSALSRDAKSALPVAKPAKKKSATNARATKLDAMSDAVEKSSKAGNGRDTKGEPPSAQMGACLAIPHVEIVDKAYIEATHANPNLSSIEFFKDGEIFTAFD